jgi:hypothetical protein
LLSSHDLINLILGDDRHQRFSTNIATRPKIDEPTANRLAAEGAGHGATEEDLIYADNISNKPIPFFVYQGLSPPPADGSFGFFGVNPWTGDVWALWGCRRLSTPALRKSQVEIRKRFTTGELKQYAKLRRIRPDCIYDAHERQ